MADLRELERALAILDEEEPDPLSVADWAVQIPALVGRGAVEGGRLISRFLEERGEAVRGSLAGADLPGEFGQGAPEVVEQGFQAAESVLPEIDPRAAASVPGRVASTLGQIAPGVALGAVGGLGAAATYGGIQEGQAVYEDILSRLPRGEDAYQKAQTGRLVGLAVGLLDAIPVGKILGKLDWRSGGTLGRLLGLVDKVPAGISGGVTEGIQSGIENLAVEHLTGQDVEILRQGLEEGLYGGAAFGILDAVLGRRSRGPRGGAEPEAPAIGPGREGVAPEALRAPERGAAEPRRKERDLLREAGREPSRALPETAEDRRFSELLNEASDEEFQAAVERMSPEESTRLIEKMGQYLLPRGPELEAAVEAEIQRGVPALEAEIRERTTRPLEVALREEDEAHARAAEPEEGEGRLFQMQAFPGNLLPGRKRKARAPAVDEGFGLPPERVQDRLYRYLADKFAPVKRIEEASARAGQPVLEHEKGYRAEELFSSRAKARLDEAERTYLEPIKRDLRRRGVDLDTVDDYLTALVASEVNRAVQARGAENPRLGAGMSDADAAAIIARVESGPRSAVYRRVASLVRRLNDQRLDLLVRYELVSQEEADTWRELYPNYVPLRSFARNLRGFTPARTGSGFSIRGKESKRRRGRTSRADSPLIFSLLQLDETIIRGEKNLVSQQLVNFFDARPSEHWRVSEGRGQVEFNELTGEVETTRYDPRFQLAELSFAAKFRGREVIVTFDKDSQLLARAIKNMGSADTGDALKYLRGAMRLMSKLATAYNPEFMLANFEKDLQTAGIHLAATPEGRRAWKRAFHPKSIGGAIKAGYEGLRGGEAKGEWRAWWDRYRQSGAKIDWYYSESAEQRLERLNKDIEKLKNPDSSAWEVVQSVAEWVDNANGAIENGVRLSAFRALVQNGTSEADAASFTKNMTVNFTRRGEWGSVGNTLYLFWQAGISGNVTLIRNLKRSKVVRGIAGGIITEGLIMDIVNRLLSPRDDDGNLVYDTIPDWIKEHNFVLMIPGRREAFMFPLPWGYNVFHNVGRAMGSATHGDTSPQDAAFSAFRSMVQAFNPLGGEATAAQLVSPTLLDPFVSLGENRSFAGTPIVRENYEFGFQRPDSELYWNSTGRPYVSASKALNRLTGGDEAERGAVDVSPDTIEFLAEFATKGAGSFVRRVQGLFETGFDTPASEVPFLRRQLWAQAEWQSRSAYYDNRHEIEQAKGRLRYWERQIDEGVRVPYARQKLRAAERDVGWLNGLDPELRRVERALRRTEDEAERRRLQQAFNRLVNEARARR